MRYAVTDIETTGSFAQGNGITEIAICIVENDKVISEFQSLVNPQREIPYFISRLTGIDAEMLQDAPTFASLAAHIDQLTENCVFVAHNVNFDYGFIKHQMEAAGYSWNRQKLCTLQLSRRYFPGLRSYSLSNLCQNLKIVNHSPHRALGDTKATVALFLKIQKAAGDSLVQENLKRGNQSDFLPPHLDIETYQSLPNAHGVYFFHDKKGKVIYVGKAIDIKKRIRGHFSGNLHKAQKQAFISEVYNISYQLTGTELLALLIEDMEIKKRWPKYNQAQKTGISLYGIVHYEDQSGCLRLGIQRIRNGMKVWRGFHSPVAAREWLFQLAAENNLENQYCGLPVQSTIARSIEEHNASVKSALDKIDKLKQSLWLKLPGRHGQEYAVVKAELGQIEGYAFIDDHNLWGNFEKLKEKLIPCLSFALANNLFFDYIERASPNDLLFEA